MNSLLLDLSTFLNIIGLAGSLLLALTYFIKWKPLEEKTNLWLGLIFSVVVVVTLNTILIFSRWSAHLPFYEAFSNGVSYFLGPFIYLLSLTTRESFSDRSDLKHLFIPFALFLINAANYFFPDNNLLVILAEGIFSKAIWNLILFGYLLAAALQVQKLKDVQSEEVKVLIWGVLIVATSNLLFLISRSFISQPSIPFYLNVTLLFGLLVIYFLVRAFTINKRFFHPNLSKSDETLKDHFDKINRLIEQNEFYTDPELSIRSLADKLDLPYHKLSKMINSEARTNFNEFINTHRIKKVKEGLDKNLHEKYTILGLSEQAGFKTASTFYKAFKKETGTTPLDYLKGNN